MANLTMATLAVFSISLTNFTVGVAHAADAIEQTQFEERFSGAVSEINGKIEFGGVHYDFENDFFTPSLFDSGDGYFVQGAISAPISSNFGAQIDVGYLNADLDLWSPGPPPPFGVDVDGRGFAGHLFWRDATVGLLGVYAAKTDYEFNFGDGGPTFDIDNIRYGVEAEAYFDRITFKGFAGVDRTDFPIVFAPILGSLSESFLAAKGEVNFYMTDNIVLKAGFDHSFESTAATLGFEAMWDTGGVSPTIFADASFDDGNTTVLAGLKLYFGSASKSLKQRHREDDPEIGLFDNVNALGACLSKQGNSILLVRGARPEGARYIMPNYSLDGCELTSDFAIGSD